MPFNVNEPQPIGMTGDSVEHLNMWASGAPHGIDGRVPQPTEELLRALELPATYTALLVSGNDYLGAVNGAEERSRVLRDGPGQSGLDPDGRLRREASGVNDKGDTVGLKYYWDFGDGTTAVGKTVTHTFASPVWADVKLVVAQGGNTDKWGVYRQAVAVDSPSGAAPSTPACGTLSAAERDSLVTRREGGVQGETADRRKGGSVMRSARPQAFHSLLGSPRLVLVAATVIAARLASTTNATPAAGAPVSNKAHPVIDANWIYAENWFDATNFIYKVAGSDGCLPSATSCGTGDQTDRQQQPARELQRHAGVLLVVEGPRDDEHAAAQRPARQVHHGA